MKLHLAAAAIALQLAACASTQSVKETTPVYSNSDAARDAAIDELLRNFQRVRFEFDSSLITPDTQEALALNVQIMNRYPELQLEVEGHCDEIGSTEYNLALGQRRAEAIKKYMHTAGIEERRIRTVSFGEEVPLALGETSDELSQNRRAEFRVTYAKGTGVHGTVATLAETRGTFARR